MLFGYDLSLLVQALGEPAERATDATEERRAPSPGGGTTVPQRASETAPSA